MGNSYFSFKQFTVEQERCAMKVGTDGVLLGAWADVSFARHLLDVGTGTGLVALMAAQRSEAQIVAVDIDAEAVRQARENAARSPWGGRIVVEQTDFLQWKTPLRFDAIVCNPPYFENSLKCPDRARTLSRHNDTLPLADFMKGCRSLLTEEGSVSVVLPVERAQILKQEAARYGLFLQRETGVLPLQGKKPKRVLLAFSRKETDCDPQWLCIETEHGHYSDEFVRLMQPFYLKL